MRQIRQMHMPTSGGTAGKRTTAGMPRDVGTAEKNTTPGCKYGAFDKHTLCACVTEDAEAGAEARSRSGPAQNISTTGCISP